MLQNRFSLDELNRLVFTPLRSRFGQRLIVTGGCQFDHDKPEDGFLALVLLGNLDPDSTESRLDRDELVSILGNGNRGGGADYA